MTVVWDHPRVMGSSLRICLISCGAKTSVARGWWCGGGGGGGTLEPYNFLPQWPSSSTGLPDPVVAAVPPPAVPRPNHGEPPAPTIVELGKNPLHSSDRVVKPCTGFSFAPIDLPCLDSATWQLRIIFQNQRLHLQWTSNLPARHFELTATHSCVTQLSYLLFYLQLVCKFAYFVVLICMRIRTLLSRLYWSHCTVVSFGRHFECQHRGPRNIARLSSFHTDHSVALPITPTWIHLSDDSYSFLIDNSHLAACAPRCKSHEELFRPIYLQDLPPEYR